MHNNNAHSVSTETKGGDGWTVRLKWGSDDSPTISIIGGLLFPYVYTVMYKPKGIFYFTAWAKEMIKDLNNHTYIATATFFQPCNTKLYREINNSDLKLPYTML